MPRKRKVTDRTKIAQKMSTYMMLMGYNGDYHATVAKDLNRRVWKRKSKLSRKRCRRLLYLLCAADSSALLSYTVSLGRLVWRDNLRAKRKIFEKKFREKITQRSKKKTLRKGRLGKARSRRGLRTVKKEMKRKGNVAVRKIISGLKIRPIWGSRLRVVVRRSVTRNPVKVVVGSPMYRLAMAMDVLSTRNVYITSEWEFWTICFVQKVCGFWRSIAFGEGLSDSFVAIASKFGLNVVSSEVLDRLESCYGCSSTSHYLANYIWPSPGPAAPTPSPAAQRQPAARPSQAPAAAAVAQQPVEEAAQQRRRQPVAATRADTRCLLVAG